MIVDVHRHFMPRELFERHGALNKPTWRYNDPTLEFTFAAFLRCKSGITPIQRSFRSVQIRAPAAFGTTVQEPRARTRWPGNPLITRVIRTPGSTGWI